ncbi:hypothetical protein A3715_11505 [Oleiphilus sp. HI0009]|uniref:DUF6488 family protein n=1 Tax=unclassified Oleiphilus TaxID=2631174 RepID=UPI0007C3CE99|nr:MULTISPECIES: DUF6488 family protein [unclassified Oleiphilus]KZX77097.1 hypothetical protein A3715_11505 [Oleiphilus sp. HI0009]KZY61303.1 hypothetical protein A3738_14160 [Oleiphilus sp. HI0066]KZY61887.1 hypothetical protein A3738_22055 [Oleiphilus sp. HI0066]KZY72842.1 hypothetical protein A3739_15555 [Oleiphilus sp. HI0067]KZZ61118.1 hypothetical protein A3762_14705 [Oleiphilus sp. HI0125]
MINFIRTLLLGAVLIFSQFALAGPGHDHSHDHQHDPITSEQAVDKASAHVQKLVNRGKIDASWAEVTASSVEEKSFGHGPEWVVSFKNDAIADPANQTLYIFYTINGKYLASNFTGQ